MATDQPVRDDSILSETRRAALVVFCILVPAVIVLWGFPGRTADLWAWTIKPDLTPIFLGSGYGAGAIVGAAVFFLSPRTAIDLWPWKLTPLTARVLASFTFQVGVGATLLSLSSRWSSWRLLIQTFFVATTLLLVGAVRAFDDFDTGNVMTYVYLGGLAGADIGLFALYRTYNGRMGA